MWHSWKTLRCALLKLSPGKSFSRQNRSLWSAQFFSKRAGNQMAKLQFAKHERLSLKGNSDFSETWLHERIKDDPSILGLGELTVIQSEKVQHAGGRLDI